MTFLDVHVHRIRWLFLGLPVITKLGSRNTIDDRQQNTRLFFPTQKMPKRNPRVRSARASLFSVSTPPSAGGGVRPIMAYTGRLRPKGVPLIFQALGI